MASPSLMDQISAAGSSLDPEAASDLNQESALRMAHSFGGGANGQLGLFNILNGVQNSSLPAQQQRMGALAAQHAVAQLSPQGDDESDMDYAVRTTKAQRDAAMKYSPDMAAQLNTKLLLLAAQRQEQAKLGADTALESAQGRFENDQAGVLEAGLPLANATKNLAYVVSANPNNALGYDLKPFDLSTPDGNKAYLQARSAPNTTVMSQEQAAKLMTQADVAQQRRALEQMKLAMTYGQRLSPDALNYATYMSLGNPSLLRSLAGYGQSGAMIRSQIMENMAAVAKQNGITPQQLEAIQASVKAEGTSIGKLVPMLNNVQAYETLMRANGDKLKELIGKVDVTGVPAFEGAIRWAKANGGNIDTNLLRSVLNSFQSETAKILNSPNLSGGLPKWAKEDMQQVISGKLDAPSMIKIINRLYAEADIRRAGISSQIYNAQGTIGGMLGGQNSFGPTPGAGGAPPSGTPGAGGAGSTLTFDTATGTFK